MGNTFGTLFRVTTFGESHGPAMGVVIDGCPAGIKIEQKDFLLDLEKRKPKSKFSTSRREPDEPEILSGIFEGKTTGTPIAILVRNKSQNSKDYDELKDVFRPGHADLTYFLKYGHCDYRGGGRASGRETVARVLAGTVAKKILGKGLPSEALAKEGTRVEGLVEAIGGIQAEQKSFKFARENELFFADKKKLPEVEKLLEKTQKAGDSVGGVIELRIKNVPAGLGEPVFDKLDAELAKALMSIGGVKAVEFGDGIAASSKLGSENNDAILNLKGKTKTNHAGGVSGGISNGNNLVIKLYVKPTPSIELAQETVNKQGQKVKIKVQGRHDTCIVPRIVPVAEAMVALTLADFYLRQKACQGIS
ncbi:MAG: chorismate synthase [Candidatus Gracilibacteria bacterium]|nr:chorismate synthase [Candidatus Gracilibacteria bacterium]